MEVTTPIKDVISFNLFEKDLTEKRVGDGIKTTERKIPFTDDLKWWIEYFPAGSYQEYQRHVSVYIRVNKNVSVKATSIGVEGSSIQRLNSIGFFFRYRDLEKFASHEDLQPLFKNGQVTIKCSVEFLISIPVITLRAHIFESLNDGSADFELVIGSDHVKVHKNFLALLSPVFNAMFSHDTAEVRTGKDVITDFDFETVKAAIDFCYGKGFLDFSTQTIIEMLRFADKYDIKAITATNNAIFTFVV
uniref:BTB domain-containing protein n=1 Tax=Panagrellus redivivus TaxID=6233 RepID=A0A7E4WBQ6_PANRE